MSKKLYIETVGCQMNVLDSELVVGSLRRQGYELTDSAAAADVILFNTCSVRLPGLVRQLIALAAQAAHHELAVEHVHLAADGLDVKLLGHVRPHTRPGTSPAARSGVLPLSQLPA